MNKKLYSNKLNLDYFFYYLRKQIYVVIKLGSFPNYYLGADIDIFAYDKDKFAREVLKLANKYVERKDFKIKVMKEGRRKNVIDFYYQEKLAYCIPQDETPRNHYLLVIHLNNQITRSLVVVSQVKTVHF